MARRPKLAAALAHAKKLKAPVIVSKLCRLGRDVAFIIRSDGQPVPFIVAELGPTWTPSCCTSTPRVAQKERSLIAARTSEALQAAKRRGVKLGQDREAASEGEQGGGRGSGKVAVTGHWKIPEQWNYLGTCNRSELNRRGIPTAKGASWYPAAKELRECWPACDRDQRG